MIGIKPRLCSSIQKSVEKGEEHEEILSRDFQTDSAVVEAESIDDR